MSKTKDIWPEEVTELHCRYPSIDLHVHTLMWSQAIGYNMCKRHRRAYFPRNALLGQVDLPRLHDINAAVQFFSVVTAPFARRKLFRVANRQIDKLAFFCELCPEQVTQIKTRADLVAARRCKQVGALLSMEGAHFLEGNLDNLHNMYARGLRSLGLVHFSSNAAGHPSFGLGKQRTDGLTDFGRQLVDECNDLGVLLGLAHLNEKGTLEVCARSKAPVYISHTGARGIHPHPRNALDSQLRAVADTGGVIGIMYVSMFLGGSDVATVLRHLEYTINIAGEQHVALGSDWDGMMVPIRGLEHVGRLPNLTAAMLKAGWSEKRIGRILHGNAQRLLQETLR